ncbi:OLC1v1018880C1 [Oldenlandia corymbosa var. corymbosa]|uniref:OLC1v1018880C1 n=1 Tax=Oldenlandia corymbosa var. corymbosa TaxID=529605 RepID=A0AAV1ECQ7_OLDCO|nr:OLC1v1018880C1 [Oldenlandia corymbosa var. corymbosa]
MLDFSELVDKVYGVMEVDRKGLYIDFSLVWTERSGKRSRVHINDDNTVRFIYLCADKWPELYPENVERICHVYASTSGQDISASTSGGRTVEDNKDEDGDEDEDKDEDEDEDGGGVESSDDEYVPSDEDSDDDTDFESSSSVPYVFDDISGWDKTLEEVDCDGIKMWDGNPLTLGLDVHFTNKPEAQAAVGEWNLANIDMIQKCQNVLPPKPMKLYEEARKKSLRQKVNRFCKKNQKYEVVTIAPDNQQWKAEEKQVVLYVDRECTCGRWQTFRFPYSHAPRVARGLGDDPFPLFDPCYSMHQWYQQFPGEFNPIMEPWPKATWQIRPDNTKLVHHAGRGRKRVNRKKGVMDYTSKSGQRRLQTCSLCKPQGHNARACPYARVCARCGSLDHDAVECPFSHPPADRTVIDKLYDPYGIRAIDIGSSSSSQCTSKKLRQGPRDNSLLFLQNAHRSHNVFHGTQYDIEISEPRRIPGDTLLLTVGEITSLLKRKPFGGSDRRWIQQLGIYLQVWNDRHGRLVGTDDDYVGEPTADPEYLLWYHQATLMEDVRSLSIIGQRTFDADSFGYDRLGEIGQVAERALSVNATNVVRHDLDRHVESLLDGQSIHYTSNFLSSMFQGVASQHQADDPVGGERESKGEDEDEDEAEDADQDDQFEGQGYQRHEEQGSSQTLGTPPLAIHSGRNTSIWMDRWLPCSEDFQCHSPPSIIHPSSLVSDLIDQSTGNWNQELINSIFSPSEASCILSMMLGDAPTSDKWIWHHSTNGRFSVKSVYSTLMASPNFSADFHPSVALTPEYTLFWKKLWKLRLPNCILHFLWRCATSSLPSLENLEKRGCFPDQQCPLCHNTTGTTSHVIFWCSYATQAWIAAGIRDCILRYHDLRWDSWVKMVILKCDRKVAEVFAVICNSLWYARNEFLFENKQIAAHLLASRSVNMLKEFQMANGSLETSSSALRSCHLMPPS